MVSNKLISQLKKDFSFVQDNPTITAVILYGSQATGDATSRSDIDICIVAPRKDVYETWQYIVTHIERDIEPFDIRVFEAMPLYMKWAVIITGVIIIVKDEPALMEYFFPFRKSWDDHEIQVKYCI